jgi:hypothetical protein
MTHKSKKHQRQLVRVRVKCCDGGIFSFAGDEDISKFVDELKQLRSPDIFKVHYLLEVMLALQVIYNKGNFVQL